MQELEQRLIPAAQQRLRDLQLAAAAEKTAGIPPSPGSKQALEAAAGQHRLLLSDELGALTDRLSECCRFWHCVVLACLPQYGAPAHRLLPPPPPHPTPPPHPPQLLCEAGGCFARQRCLIQRPRGKVSEPDGGPLCVLDAPPLEPAAPCIPAPCPCPSLAAEVEAKQRQSPAAETASETAAEPSTPAGSSSSPVRRRLGSSNDDAELAGDVHSEAEQLLPDRAGPAGLSAPGLRLRPGH